MKRAYKYRLRPTAEQEIFFMKSFGCTRYIYNYMLAKRIEAYQRDKTRISWVEMCRMLTDLKKQEGMQWISEVSNECLQQSIRNMDSAFVRFFREKKGFPRFKSKHRSRAAYKAINAVAIDFPTNRVRLPKVGWVKFAPNRMFEGKICSMTVSKTSTGKYYVSVLVEDGAEMPEKAKIDEATAIGIDVGIKDFAVCSNGDVFRNPKYLEQSARKLKMLQRRFSKTKKGGNRHEWLRKKLAKQYEKVTNQRTDYLHKVSTKLVRENQTIIIEDLNVRGMMQNHKLSRAIGSVGWFTFFNMLQYKCDWYGRNLIKIGRFEPSSKTCGCGYVYRELKLSQRKWTCPECGAVNDRDLLAACNIKKFGIINNQPVAHGGLDGEDRISGPVKRQNISV